MSNVPDNAPQHCPGTQSDDAGKASACAGCPNQNICASGAASLPDPAIDIIKNRLATVKHKILILSGKGGVGKSTVTSLLGHALAAKNADMNVGILDADICGPSQPRVLGVRGEQVHNSGSGWSPVYVTDNLSLMSIGFLLGSPDDAVIWRGPKKNGMIKQFLSEVDWGELDYLLIDTPPGTSDEHLSSVQYLSKAGLTGAIVVTTPQEVALLDVRKELNFCSKLGVRVLGVVENMSLFVCPNCNVIRRFLHRAIIINFTVSCSKLGVRVLGVVENMSLFICPNCNARSEIFPATTGGAPQMCSDLDVPLLGSLPLDPFLARCCDNGQDFITELPNSPAVVALKDIVDKMVTAAENPSK